MEVHLRYRRAPGPDWGLFFWKTCTVQPMHSPLTVTPDLGIDPPAPLHTSGAKGHSAWEEKERGFTVTCPSPPFPFPQTWSKRPAGKGSVLQCTLFSSLALYFSSSYVEFKGGEGGNRRGDGECTFYNIGGSMTCSGTHTAVTLFFGT